MTYPSAEEPDRLDTTGQTASAEPPAPVEPEAGGQVSEPAAPVLSEKPVLEWTTEDWARWIEEPALLSPPAPEAKAEDVRIEGDPTSAWSLPVDEDEEDAKWWSAVAGLPNVAPATPAPATPPAAPPAAPPAPPPAPPDEAGPELITPPPAPITPPPFPAPSIAPPPPPPPPLPLTPSFEAPPASAPPVTDTRRSDPETAARRPQHTRAAPEVAAPSRSPQSRRASLEPIDDIAVRVRAGLSLLGVSVLVGAVTAGLITVAIFMASVVLRRALG